jgi:xanthine dehydrogenase accessory factor
MKTNKRETAGYFWRPYSQVKDCRETPNILIEKACGDMHDKTVLRQALKTHAGYLGMMGSRKKREGIFEALLQEGFTTDDFASVYSPIGLKIGAETPEELAVCILGELIQVRADKNR